MKRRVIYFAGFFLTFSAALSYYANSSFLANVVGEERIGLVYFVISLGSLIVIGLTPRLIKWLGLKTLTRLGGLILTLAYLGLALGRLPGIQLAAFFLVYNAAVALSFWLDLCLESLSRDGETGRIRGGYLTVINAAVLISPLISTNLLGEGEDFSRLYRLCFLATLPLLFLLWFKLKPAKLSGGGHSLWQKLLNPNLRRVLLVDLWLNLFYFIMVVYMPIHLHEKIGLSWESIGLVFTIMLIPFVVIEYPLGWLADRRLGEKEALTAGIILTGIATVAIFFINSATVALWAALLFATRLGASAWEAMKETYLFKHVAAGDVSTIGLSRLNVPMAYFLGSISTFFLLRVATTHTLFLVLGLFVLTGLAFSLRLADTK
ncbi:MAG: MFS transporter [Patescibacteria group bacterium]